MAGRLKVGMGPGANRRGGEVGAVQQTMRFGEQRTASGCVIAAAALRRGTGAAGRATGEGEVWKGPQAGRRSEKMVSLGSVTRRPAATANQAG